MGPVQAECQTLFVWRDACGPQLATDILSDMMKSRLCGLSRIRKKPKIYPLSLEKTPYSVASLHVAIFSKAHFINPMRHRNFLSQLAGNVAVASKTTAFLGNMLNVSDVAIILYAFRWY
jgi:hypothetical protein